MDNPSIDLKFHNAFDVVVIGGGHAGIEAAYAAARMGSSVLLITLNLDRIGHMPCNPAIGGIGKGHIVFEIAAFGGLMPQGAAQTYLQARMLNTRKGPAVQGLRLQIDKHAYSAVVRRMLEQTPNLTMITGMVEEILVDDTGRVTGIRTREGFVCAARCVVVTTGTFLNGLVHVGQTSYVAGRAGEEAARNLSGSLKNLGLELGRLKTGTPPRLLKSSLDFSRMERQESEDLEFLFEFYPHMLKRSMPCFVTGTTQETHDTIRKNAALSPIYSGKIKGIPPRYCPSIEDKIARFPHKTSHHIFIEPESFDGQEMYPNGVSTSLPLNAQMEFIRTVPGCERAILTRPGYAVEYDFVFPTQLNPTLETKKITGLFLAGQINGTTGYEEAAGQGLVAGINAHRTCRGEEAFVIDRTQGYIGIMIDDLTSTGVDEPYRMFTSRAERRLLIRQDNTFRRLGARARALGLISQELFDDMEKEREYVMTVTQRMRAQHGVEIARLLSRGETEAVCALIGAAAHERRISEREKTSIYAELLYEPYLQREEREIEKTRQYQALQIPEDFEYRLLPGLSIELQQKLMKYRPSTVSHAALVQGMTPAALALLIFRVREHRAECKAKESGL